MRTMWNGLNFLWAKWFEAKYSTWKHKNGGVYKKLGIARVRTSGGLLKDNSWALLSILHDEMFVLERSPDGNIIEELHNQSSKLQIVMIQCSKSDALTTGRRVVVYQSIKDGRVFVRDLDQFFDGRFTPLNLSANQIFNWWNKEYLRLT